MTSAQFMLDSESKLREAIQKMLTPTNPEPMEEKAENDLDDLFGAAEVEPRDKLEKIF